MADEGHARRLGEAQAGEHIVSLRVPFHTPLAMIFCRFTGTPVSW